MYDSPNARARLVFPLAFGLALAGCATNSARTSATESTTEWSQLGRSDCFARYGDSRTIRRPASATIRARVLVIGDAPSSSGGAPVGSDENSVVEEEDDTPLFIDEGDAE